MAVSLKIKGNKRTNEGIGNDLVSIGDNRFPVVDAQYPGTQGATDFIVIRHMADKSIYTIVCKNVTPCDSNREGTLYISVSIPTKEHVVGLFNMLIELQNAYKSNCMTHDGTMYHFMSRADTPQMFEEILSRYKVTVYPYKHVSMSDNMSSTAYLFMTPEQISDLLNDPMRIEFGSYSEIALVPVGNPSQYVSTINIPSKIWRSYNIVVNGRPTGQKIADPNKTVTITLPETNSHESISVTFSIAQARENNTAGISIDDETQIIHLNLRPKQKVIDRHSNKPQTPSGPRNKLTLIIIAIVAAAVLGVLVYVLLRSPEDGVSSANNGAPGHNKIEANDSIKAKTDTVKSTNEKVDDSGIIGNILAPDNENSIENADKPEAKTKAEESDTTKVAQTPKNPAEKQKELQQKYNEFKAGIDNAHKHSFADFKKLFKQRNEFAKMPDYAVYNKKAEFINRVIIYIESINDTTKTHEYEQMIKQFSNEANNLKLSGLKSKLDNRLDNIFIKKLDNTKF